jgi:hypothetical protein
MKSFQYKKKKIEPLSPLRSWVQILVRSVPQVIERAITTKNLDNALNLIFLAFKITKIKGSQKCWGLQ